MDHTIKLADFLSSVTFSNLPEEVIYKAKLCILDFVANVYGSSELEVVNRTAAYIRSLENQPAATVLGFGFKTDMMGAAFMNGTSAEALEAQDGLRFGGNHAGVAVIPAALAVAEKTGKGGKEVLEAIVAGYETANRISAAMHPHHTLSGFLPTGTCGTFGAAAAAGRLYGYNPKNMLNALGNAGYLLPISMAEQLMGGYTIKIVQGGQAASTGIMAAGLAGAGITGSPTVLEGSSLEGGFTQITTSRTGGKPNLEKIHEGLGTHYSIMDVYFKPYTACRHTHGSAQAMIELVNEHRIDPHQVREINVYTYGIAQIAVGKEVLLNGSMVSAQFSIPYVTAVSLLDRELGPRQFTEKRLADPGVINLSKKVNVFCDDDLNKMYPDKTASRIEVVLNDGQHFTRQVDIPLGDPRDPMDVAALMGKVRRFAPNRDIKALEIAFAMILGLEKVQNIKELVDNI